MRLLKEKVAGGEFGLGKLKSPGCEQEHTRSDLCTKGNVKCGRVSSTAPLEGPFPGASRGDRNPWEASPRWWREIRAKGLGRARIKAAPSWTTPTLASTSFLRSLLFSVECFHALKLPHNISKNKLTPTY